MKLSARKVLLDDEFRPNFATLKDVFKAIESFKSIHRKIMKIDSGVLKTKGLKIFYSSQNCYKS